MEGFNSERSLGGLEEVIPGGKHANKEGKPMHLAGWPVVGP